VIGLKSLEATAPAADANVRLTGSATYNGAPLTLAEGAAGLELERNVSQATSSAEISRPARRSPRVMTRSSVSPGSELHQPQSSTISSDAVSR